MLGVGIAACYDAETPLDPTAASAPAASLSAPSASTADLTPTTASLALVAAPELLPVWEPTLGTNFNLDDDDCRYVPFGFTFTFYGKGYTGAYVSSNGNVTFNSCNSAGDGFLPQDDAALAAPATGDWIPTAGGADNVYHTVVGQAPNRRFVVTWSNLRYYGGASTRRSTFQLQLVEGTNAVQLGYKLMGGAPSSVRSGVSSGTGPYTRITQGSTAIVALQGQARCLAPNGADAYTVTTTACVAAPSNRPPVVTVGGPYAGTEGAAIAFEGTASDPEGAQVTYAWDFGDGTPAASGASASHAYADNGSYTVRLTATDASGMSSSASAAVTVANVAPRGTPSAPSAVDEGSVIVLAVNDPQDPSSADHTAGFQYAFNCGEGYGAFGPFMTMACPTTDNGVRSVGLKIRDKDGDSTEYAAQVSIRNVAPRVNSVGGGVSVYSGEAYRISGTFSDPGTRDALWNYVLSWGDGRSSAGSLAEQTAALSAPHTFLKAGSYTVSLQVTDKDGGTGVGSGQVTVVRLPVSVAVTRPTIRLNENGHAKLEVAILSTMDVDASMVDPATVLIGRTPVASRPNGALLALREDANGDGRLDTVVQFDRAALVRNGDLTARTTQVTLTADLVDGRQVGGWDEVVVMP